MDELKNVLKVLDDLQAQFQTAKDLHTKEVEQLEGEVAKLKKLLSESEELNVRQSQKIAQFKDMWDTFSKAGDAHTQEITNLKEEIAQLHLLLKNAEDVNKTMHERNEFLRKSFNNMQKPTNAKLVGRYDRPTDEQMFNFFNQH